MTDEKLEKEAEEYAIENYEQCMYDDAIGWTSDFEARKQAYIAGAKPRKKRIKEAESIIKEIISTWENPRTNIPFRCAIKHAKEFIGWKE